MSLLARLQRDGGQGNEAVARQQQSAPEPWLELKTAVHSQLVDSVTQDLLALPDAEVKLELQEKASKLLEEQSAEQGVYLKRKEEQHLINSLIDEILGFGPITPLLNDESVNEVMVNGPKQVYVERKGILELTGVHFRDNDHMLQIIEKIVTPLGRRIDESSPMVDARLPDGSRVNAIIPPLAVDGPSITIRKFSKDPFQMKDLIRFNTLSAPMARFLEACVVSRLNVVVSGGTGSGKTTTLNCLSDFIPGNERIITIEDAAELQLQQSHLVRLETRAANIEGKGEVSIRDLVRNSLRMRPDRIVVGECRGGEALDMLQAMNTGHDGSLTTAHANSPRDALSRLETMVLMAGMDLPVRAIREQVASAVDLIVQQTRMKDGSRKITYITEVLGMEGDTITLQDLFVFKATGRDTRGKIVGEFKPTGLRPHFSDKLQANGVSLSPDMFAVGG